MNKRPFFSIVIPTFNRAKDLKLAIVAILQQDFKDFELIISDNNSKDTTEDVVRSFRDKRIKYYKNKKNIGWIPNLKKGILLATGEYIMLHGDDDFILYPDVLKKVNSLIKKSGYGFIRLNYVSIMPPNNVIFDFQKKIQKDLVIKPKQNKDDIINFITRIDPFFVTGIIFKNDFPKNIEIINSEFVAWFKIIFYNILTFGGYFISNYQFAASWSQNASYPRYYLNNGKFRFEKYFNEVGINLDENEYKEFLNKRLNIVIKEFPVAKYYTSNDNLKQFSKRVIELYPDFKKSFMYWFWLYFSLLTPKKALSFIRKHIFFKMITNTNIPSYDKIRNRINFLHKLSRKSSIP